MFILMENEFSMAKVEESLWGLTYFTEQFRVDRLFGTHITGVLFFKPCWVVVENHVWGIREGIEQHDYVGNVGDRIL